MNPMLAPSQPIADTHAVGPGIRSAMQRLYKAIVDGQTRRAQRIVRPHLARHDDATLVSLGFSLQEIAAIRRAPAGGLPL